MTLRTLVLTGMCLLATACGSSGATVVSGPAGSGSSAVSTVVASGSGSASAPVAGAGPAKLKVEVWLLRDGRLWPVLRAVPPTVAVVRAAVNSLLRGATAADTGAGVVSAVPAGTQLLGISLHDGIATVDLTSDLQGHGVAAERLALAQLVFTVTQYPTVRGMTLHLDGAPVAALADGLVVPNPLRRASLGFPRLVSPITVTSPRPGTSVHAPFTVTGVADVFEAGIRYRLLDASGHELGSGESSASCGSGCPGTFSFQIPELGVSHRERGTLVIAAANASGRPGGGRPVGLPLVLLPPFDVATPLPGATLTSPAQITFRDPIVTPVVLKIYDAKFHVLARRIVRAACGANCPPGFAYTSHIPFSVAGLQQGYVVLAPRDSHPAASGQVVEIPVTLNGG